jgi:hypothetical protein
MPSILIASVDAMSLVLLLLATIQAVRGLISDAPPGDPPGRSWGRLAAVLVVASALLFFWSVGVQLVGRVPDTSCGGGVLAAMGPPGKRALWMHLLAVLATLAWWDVQRLDQGGELSSRILLIWAPIVVMNARFDFMAFSSLAGDGGHHAAGGGHHDTGGCSHVMGVVEHVDETHMDLQQLALLAAALLLLALWLGFRPPRRWPLPLVIAATALLLGLVVPNVLAASAALPGPWKLLLAQHGRIGFPLFAGLFLVTASGAAPLWTCWLARRLDLTTERTEARHRWMAGVLVASILASAACLVWLS